MFRRGRSGHSVSITPDDRDVVEVAVARGLIVEQVHAAGRRVGSPTTNVCSPIQRRTAMPRSSIVHAGSSCAA